MKTIQEWEKEFKIRVLDPDGFDRRDPELMTRKFTREEFIKGEAGSTIEFMPDHPIRRRQDDFR